MVAKRKGRIAEAFFREIGAEATREVIKALEEGAQLVVNDAKQRVNIGPNIKGHKPGQLRNAIKWERMGRVIVINATDAKNKEGESYGQYVEFWRKHAFLYPALGAKREEVNAMVVSAISKAVRSTVKH